MLNLKQPPDGSRERRILDTHGSYDPLSYTLLFNNGQDGWSSKKSAKHLKKKITSMAWVSFMLIGRVAVAASFDDLFYQQIVEAKAANKVKNPIHLSKQTWCTIHRRSVGQA